MLISDFPQELIDHIVGYLHGSRKDLRTCLALSPSWHASAERELFQDMVVDPTKTPLRELIVFLSASSAQDGGAAVKINPAACIQRLTIRPTAASTEPKGPLIGTQDLLSVLRICPRLHSLRLQGPVQLTYDGDLSPSDRALERLILDRVFFSGTRHKLIEAVMSFCCPQMLHISNLSCPNTPEPASTSIPGLDCVKILCLRSKYISAPLLNLIAQAAVKNLDVACYVQPDVQALVNYLGTKGKDLTHFSVDLTDFVMRHGQGKYVKPLVLPFADFASAAAGAARSLELTPCLSLTALTLRLTFMATPWSSLPFNGEIFRLASRIFASAPASLQTVTFAVTFDGTVYLSDEFFEAFKKRTEEDLMWLAGVDAERQALRKVVWIWQGLEAQQKLSDEEKEKLKNTLTELVSSTFPRLSQNGTLTFTDGDEHIWG